MRSDIHVGRGLSGTYMLLKDVTVDDSRRIGWVLWLMEVYEHERDLNRGRFANFTPEPQEWLASVRVEGPLVGDRLPQLRHEVTVMINWIAEHVETPWSLDYRENGAVRYLDFTFADSHLGFMFKILFG
jgi:hypothetical protein